MIESELITCRCGCGEEVREEGDLAPPCLIDEVQYQYGDMLRSEERDSR